VNGVGGKTALTILGLGLESIVRAIELRDDSLLASVPGIGKKTAQKIIVELAGSLNLESLRGGKQFPERDPNTLHLITSLVQMGYEKSRVENIIGELDTHLSLEEKTREVIRQLSQKS
jgi:Holliday junction DNA helicase RuvA